MSFGEWITRHASSVVLCIAGALFVVLAVWVVPEHQAVATTLVVFGAGALILGGMLPRLEGPFSIGPDGLKAIIKAVVRKACEKGMRDDQIDALAARTADVVYGKGVGRIRLRSRATGYAISPEVAEAIADEVISDITKNDVPPPPPDAPESGQDANG